MQVILLERVEHLGPMGDVVSVKDGYARNFLIPKGKALRATKASMERFERRRAELVEGNRKRREAAETASGEVDGRSAVILRQAAEGGQLYGSVSARDVVQAFAVEGVALERSQIRLEAPIKELGLHTVPVALHPEVVVSVTVNIARSPEEAEIQAGRAAPRTEDDDDEVPGTDEADLLPADEIADENV